MSYANPYSASAQDHPGALTTQLKTITHPTGTVVYKNICICPLLIDGIHISIKQKCTISELERWRRFVYSLPEVKNPETVWRSSLYGRLCPCVLRPCMWRHSWQNNGILDVTRLFYSIQHGVVNGNDCSVHGKSQSSLFLDHNVSLNIYGSTTRPHNSNLSKYRVRVRSDSPRAGGYSIVSTLNAMSPATRHGVGNETIVPCKASIAFDSEC